MDLSLSTDLALQTAIDLRQSLIEERKALETEIDTQTSLIATELSERGLDTLQLGDWTVRHQTRERTTLDKGRLVELGVSTATIEAATRRTTYRQLDIRKKAQ